MNRTRTPVANSLLLVAVVLASCLAAALGSCRGVSGNDSGVAGVVVSSSTYATTPAVPSPSPTPTATRPTATPIPSPSATPAPSATPESTATTTPRTTGEAQPPVTLYTYEVVNVFLHDPGAWTEGLVYDQGVLYESTGRHGQSSLRMVDLQSGEVLQMHALPDQYYGEGLALLDERLIQLTWQSGVGFVYDRDSFEPLRTFSYTTEGWGLTHDGGNGQVTSHLIMSDGTDTLHFLDPESFLETGQVHVYDASGPVTRLNELEYIRGEVYANIWLTDWIVTIDPDTGRVTAAIDLAGLLTPEGLQQPADVLNGIAYDPEGDRLFVTGKLWPWLFEIELVPTQ